MIKSKRPYKIYLILLLLLVVVFIFGMKIGQSAFSANNAYHPLQQVVKSDIDITSLDHLKINSSGQAIEGEDGIVDDVDAIEDGLLSLGKSYEELKDDMTENFGSSRRMIFEMKDGLNWTYAANGGSAYEFWWLTIDVPTECIGHSCALYSFNQNGVLVYSQILLQTSGSLPGNKNFWDNKDVSGVNGDSNRNTVIGIPTGNQWSKIMDDFENHEVSASQWTVVGKHTNGVSVWVCGHN